MFDLSVNGGMVVTSSGVGEVCIGVSDGVIAAVATSPLQARQPVDASGKLVLPGLIDPHVHLNAAAGGVESVLAWSDDYETGTEAAAAGGVTTVLDMVVQARGESPSVQLARYAAAAAGRALVDYGFHVGLTQPQPGTLAEIPRLVGEGFLSFKMFLTYPRWGIRSDLGFVHAVMEEVAAAGAVLAVHCEQDDIVQWHRRRVAAAGGEATMRLHNASRPALAEEVAIRECGALAAATGAAFYPVHVSSARGLDAVRALKAEAGHGPLYAETAAHYLLLDDSVMEPPDAPLYFTTPPLRPASDCAALWEGVRDGTIDWLGSDHGPHSIARKRQAPTLAPGGPDDEYACPPGLPGIQFTLPLLYEEAVVRRGVGLPRLADLLSRNAADALGLLGKGRIEVGCDADLVVFDPRERWRIERRDIRGASEYSPYEGRSVQGRPELTISRGEIVYAEGRVRGEPGRGRLVRRRRAER